jgi:hypothetical protein
MALLVGALLAFTVGLFATVSGLDRDRAFYPTVAIVIASYYSLFAVMGGSTRALLLESLVAGAFLAGAVLGFRSSLWVVVITLAAQPLGLLRLESDEFLVTGEPQEGTIVAATYAYFDTLGAAQAALARTGHQLLESVPEYTDLVPELVMSQVTTHA